MCPVWSAQVLKVYIAAQPADLKLQPIQLQNGMEHEICLIHSGINPNPNRLSFRLLSHIPILSCF